MPYFGVPIRNGLPIGLGSQAGFGIAPFDPRDLFSAGEQGAWYDPSDLTTLFTDSAGTTPVTGVEQFVGLMLDKSKGGVGTNGPQRYNLLTYTEQFDNAAWLKSNVTVTANAGVAPNGTTTADLVYPNSTGANRGLYQAVLNAVSGLSYTNSISLKASGIRYVCLSSVRGTSARAAWFDLQTGTVGTVAGGVTASIASEGSGWYRCSVTDTASGTTVYFGDVILASADNSTSVTANGTDGVLFWGADLRLASQANLAPTYQRITDSWSATISGNHATSTGTKRPKLAARYNLLTYTEQFDNGAWAKNNCTISANSVVAPDGTTTADTLTATAVNDFHYVNRVSAPFPASTSLYRFFVKKANNRWIFFGVLDSSLNYFDLDNGVFGTKPDTCTATALPNGWWEITVSRATTVAANGCGIGIAQANGVASFAATGTEAVYVWGADLRPASQATGLIGPTYQRVVDAATYDTAGFLPYLVADGIDDAMNTGNIVPGTDKAQVFVGLRKLTDAAQGVVAEFSATIASNNGTLLLAAPDGATQTYGFDSKGTAQVDAVASSLAAPRTNVVTGLADIAGDSCVIRVNGAVADTDTGDQGTGDYLTYPLYLFGRGGTSVYFNGWMYGLIVRFGPNLSTSQIESTEAYLNQKSGAY